MRTVHTHASLQDFLSTPELQAGGHAIRLPGCSLDLLYESCEASDMLVVSFAAAASDRSRLTLPYFSGVPLLRRHPVNKLFISDPVFQLCQHINIGWYAGVPGQFGCSEISAVIRLVQQACGAQRLLFLGGSGGGFAALLHAGLLPNALALVWNPQTDIFRYDPGHLQKFLALCARLDPTGDYSPPKARETLQAQGIVTEVATLLAREQNPARIIYVQEESDWHAARHLEPFLAALQHEPGSRGPVNERLYVVSGSHGKGHGPPSREFLDAAVECVLQRPFAAFHDTGAQVQRLCREYEALATDCNA